MQNIWIEILEYARWAPSPHNVQAWKFKILSNLKAQIFYDPSRLLPITDPTGAFSVVGLAMFVDSICLVAKNFNYEIDVTYEKKPFDFHSKEPVIFANLTLSPTSNKKSFDIELIKNRRTSRLPYNGSPVSEEKIIKFQKEAEKFGHRFFTSSESKMVKWIMNLNRDTLFYDMGNDKGRGEIGKFLRYSDSQANKLKDGLWSYCFNIPGWFMKLFFDYEKFFELPVIKHFLLAFYATTMRGTKTVAWIKGPFHNFDDYVRAGYAFNRIWLKMAEENVYLHPFGSVITNKSAHARLREKFKTDESKEMIWLLLRIGYSKIPPRSLRLDLDDILIK